MVFKMKRTFIGVKVDAGEKLKDAILSIKEGLINENIKWVDFSNLHVTLSFIGDTEESMINRIVSVLKKDLKGFDNIDFEISGSGVFRNFNDPKIIFSGIENYNKLAGAHEIVKKGLAGLDIKLELRSFKPHLTIGRIKNLKDKDNLKCLIQKYEGTTLQNVTVSEIVFYESILLPEGPVYKPIDIISLKD
jgi:2'-5' RNA ligase